MFPVTPWWSRRLHLLVIGAFLLNLLPPSLPVAARAPQPAVPKLAFPYPETFAELQPPFDELAAAAPVTKPNLITVAAPLAQTTTISLTLQNGWNLIALPLTPATATPVTVFATIAGSYDLVYGYDGCAASNPWKKYNPGGPPFANTLTTLTVAQGLWIRALGATTLTLQGAPPANTTLALCQGWNLISYPTANAVPIATALAGIAGKYDLIYGYNASNTANPWQKYNPTGPPFANTLSQLQAGRGYWLRATTATTLTVQSGPPPTATPTATPTSTPTDVATSTPTLTPTPTATSTPFTVDLTATPLAGTTPLEINFTASIQGKAGEAVNYTWNFADGNTQTGSVTLSGSGVAVLQLAHTYSSQGNFTATFTATTAATASATDQVNIIASTLTALAAASPADGETAVATTRETILEFSGPLDPATVTDTAFVAQFGGKPLAKRIQLSSDQQRVTLFYADSLPGSARVQVTIDGDLLRDIHAAAVDVDEDGVAGGVRTLGFDTLSITVLPNTTVCGRVFASELAADGQTSVNVPLEGATITVDGKEDTLRATTDNLGNFCLDPAPAGTFFVHIDGRTASNGVPPGAYYPFVGKAWESTPGTQTNIGDIYLPLVPAGTMQTVSAAQETVIGFAPAVLAQHPDFASVAITVPANSLYSDDGTYGGRVGIAPVPPDRLPGELPPGLEFPLVITVQTDGATNFDQPVPACFPNLPDPVLGVPLPAGTRNYLYSFNHDTGRFEPVGPMTVTADGRLICTDPGVGIVAPGWHGSGPPPAGPPPPPPPPPCPTCCPGGGGPNPARAICLKEALEDYGICAGTSIAGGLVCTIFTAGGCAAAAVVAVAGCTVKLGVDTARCEKKNPLCVGSSGGTARGIQPFQSFSTNDLTMNSNSLLDDPIADQLIGIYQQVDNLVYPYVVDGKNVPAAVQAQIDVLVAQADAIAGGDSAQYLRNYNLTLENEIVVSQEPSGNAPAYPVKFAAAIKRPSGTLFLRGETGPYGQYTLFIPRDGSVLHVSFYDARTQSYGIVFPNTRINAPYVFPHFYLRATDETFTDFDSDGLPDVVELVYGTDLNHTDSDSDSISDGAEVQNGTNPLDGVSAQTGIIATADTPGTAVDVCAVSEGVIAVADAEAGVALFNIFNNMNPTIIAQVETPGNAQALTCVDNWVIVADGSEGLSVINVANPANAFVERRVALGNARAVAALGERAYVLTDSELLLVDLTTGAVLARLTPDAALQDVTISGDFVYILAVGQLYTLPLERDTLQVVSTVNSPGSMGAGGRRLRVFAGDGRLYATHTQGYNTFSVAVPSQPVLTAAGATAQYGWKQIVDNGSGLGVAAVSPNSTNDGPHDVWLYDVSDPTQTDRFLTRFDTPGLAAGLLLWHGLAYVADSEAGLQVINYQAYDTQGVAPTLTLSTNFAPGVAEANSRLRVTAHTEDDVQVRNVEFYRDGVLQATDGAYPFETWLTTPDLATQSAFLLRAKATDSGGNVTWTDPLTTTLTADARAPYVVNVTPADGNFAPPGQIVSVTVGFNETLNPATINSSAFQLFEAGPDKLLETADDQVVTGSIAYNASNKQVSLTPASALGEGRYRVVLSGAITDGAGNGLAGGDYRWRFTVGLMVWDGGGDGVSWHDANNWEGDQLPVNGALVVIDRNVSSAVVYNQGELTLTSLQSNQPLRMEGGKLTINTTSVISNNLVLSNGELSGSGTVTVTGVLTWTGGTMSGSGQTVAAGGLHLTGYSVILNQRHLENLGNAIWHYGDYYHYLYLTNGAVFTNRVGATFTDVGTDNTYYSYLYDDGSAVRFDNLGSYVKTSANHTQFNTVFNNQGTVAVQAGLLDLQRAGGSSGGSFSIGAGSRLRVSADQNFTAGAAFSGAGEMEFTGGTVTFSGPYAVTGTHYLNNSNVIFSTGKGVTLTSLVQSGGELSGSDTITVTGVLTWTGGVMSGSGRTIAAGGLHLTGYSVTLNQRRLENLGSAIWQSGDYYHYLALVNGAVFTNRAGATFTDVGGDGNYYGYLSDDGSAVRFDNLGSYVKTSANHTQFNTVFNNQGTVAVQAGLLDLQRAGGSSSGSFSIGAGSRLRVSADQSFTASAAFSGAGEMEFAGGTVAFSGPYAVTGTHYFNNGNAIFSSGGIPFTSVQITNGSATFSTGKGVTLASLVQHGGELRGSDTITVTGVLTWTGGVMSGSGQTIAAGGLHLTGYSVTLNQRRLENLGSAIWHYEDYYRYISLANGAVFTNRAGATFTDVGGDSTYYGYLSGDGSAVRFDNLGSYVKAGANATQFNTVFNNHGTVAVQAGLLDLQGAGGSSSGSFSIGAGSRLRVSADQNFTASAAFSGAGEMQVTGGTVTFSGPYAVTGMHYFDGGHATFSSSGGIPFTSVQMGNGSATFSTGKGVTLAGLVQSGGELSGSDTITVTGVLTWTGGTMSGSGQTIAAGGLHLTGYSVTLNQRRLDNLGSAIWQHEDYYHYLALVNGAVFTNRAGATFTDVGGEGNYYGYLSSDGSAVRFDNLGSYVKTSANHTQFNTVFNNQGTVAVQAGLLDLQRAGGSSSGSFSIGAGSRLRVSADQSFTASAAFSGAGEMQVTGGTVTFSGPYAVTGMHYFDGGHATFSSSGGIPFTSVQMGNGSATFSTGKGVTLASLVQSGGELSGSDTITVTGVLTWTGGTMSGSGRTISTGNLVLGSGMTLSGRTFDNVGVATWHSANYYRWFTLTGGAHFTNRTGATFLDQAGDSGIYYGTISRNDNSSRFDNLGTYQKSGTDATHLSADFINSGLFTVEAGLVRLQSGSNSGTTTITPAATIDIDGFFENEVGGLITGAGTLDLSGATFTNNGTIDPTVIVIQ